MADVLLHTCVGRVAVLTLNRPEILNALDTQLMRRLVDAIRGIAEDDAIGCVVLTGAGRGFCSGGDSRAISKATSDRIDNKTPAPASTLRRARWLRRSADASRLLHEMDKPTIAMINGPCAGAGLSLAAACDLRYASASASFRPAFTANGMPGDYGGSWLWTRILGTAKARELLLLDEKRDAAQALAFGLVNEVLPDEELVQKVMKLAERLADLPPTALAYAKANLNNALSETFSQSLDRESHNMILARNALVDARRAEKARGTGV